jgi:hypothetical protein
MESETPATTLEQGLRWFGSEMNQTPFSRFDPNLRIVAGIAMQVQASTERSYDNLIESCWIKFSQANEERAREIAHLCLEFSARVRSDHYHAQFREIGQQIWADGGTLAMAYALCRIRVETQLPFLLAMSLLFKISEAWDGIGDDSDKWLERFVASLFAQTISSLTNPSSRIPVLVALEANLMAKSGAAQNQRKWWQFWK